MSGPVFCSLAPRYLKLKTLSLRSALKSFPCEFEIFEFEISTVFFFSPENSKWRVLTELPIRVPLYLATGRMVTSGGSTAKHQSVKYS